MKTIRLFEAFAGIGSQYKALKAVAKNNQWKIKPVGMIEWYVDAIVGYIAIHYPNQIKKVNEWNNDVSFNLKKLHLSIDSKNLASQQTLNKLIKQKPYLGLDKYNKERERERERPSLVDYIYYSWKYTNNLFDITTVKATNIPKNIDVFTYSFPCQDLSIQGKQKGMLKNSNTRSSLLWELERIFTEINLNFKHEQKPKYLLLENVKNIISKNHKPNYDLWLKFLTKMGYASKTYVLNAVNFNSAQNRERVFCLSVRQDFQNKVGFQFPDLHKIKTKTKKLKHVLIKDFDYETTLLLPNLSKYSFTTKNKTNSGIVKSTLQNYSTFNSEAYVYYPEGIGPTLTASGANSRIKVVIDQSKNQKLVIRKMSGCEAYKYMGFSKRDYLNVKQNGLLTDEKIIFTAGNSISVEVLKALFKELKF